jgi:hypothetical protein
MSGPHLTTRFAPDGGLALANFVRSSDLNPNIYPHQGRKDPRSGNPASPFIRKHRNLTTGTFNLIVKDRNRSPPKRCAFSPEQNLMSVGHLCPAKSDSVCPRNPLKISFCLRASQLPEFTGFPHTWLTAPPMANRFPEAKGCFSRSRIRLPSPLRAPLAGDSRRNAAVFPQLHAHSLICLFGTSRVGRLLVKKKIVWRFLRIRHECLIYVKPFEERCPRIESPVAEANSSVFLPLAGLLHLMPGLRERFNIRR